MRVASRNETRRATSCRVATTSAAAAAAAVCLRHRSPTSIQHRARVAGARVADVCRDKPAFSIMPPPPHSPPSLPALRGSLAVCIARPATRAAESTQLCHGARRRRPHTRVESRLVCRAPPSPSSLPSPPTLPSPSSSPQSSLPLLTRSASCRQQLSSHSVDCKDPPPPLTCARARR